MEAIRVFNTNQSIRIEGGEIVTAPAISDHTMAVIQHMTSVRIEEAIRSVVTNNILGEIADHLNRTGRGLYADRADLAGDGVSHLALMGWHGFMRMKNLRALPEEPVKTRDLWNGDEGNDNQSMH